MTRSGRGFREKIISFNLAIFSILLFILFFGFFIYWSSTSQSMVESDLNTLAQVKINQLSDKIWNMDRTAVHLSSDLFFSSDIFGQLDTRYSEENYFLVNRIENAEVVSRLLPFSLDRASIYRICLYNDNSDFVSVGAPMEYRATDAYLDSEEFRSLSEEFNRGANRVILPPREDPLHYQAQLAESERIITVVRRLTDLGSRRRKYVGYVEVQQTLESFIGMFADLETNISYVMLDEQGQVILSGGPKGGEIDGQFLQPVPDRRSLTATADLEEFGLRLILVNDNSYLFRMSLILGAVLFLTLVIIVLGFVTTERVLIHRLTRPLDDLNTLVNNVDLANLDFDYKLEGDIDQIQHLDKAFREMLRKLRTSFDDVLAARTDELRSHLYALHAQMKPHFIHNIIAIISSLAEDYEATEIEDICSKLSSIIRYTSHYSTSDVALSEEIAHGRDYLDLMKTRYVDRLTFSVEIKGDASVVRVPKFMIQPIIENCFKHGFRTVAPPWYVSISVSVNEEEWSVTIRDNGSGFSPQSLDELELIKADIERKSTGEILENLQIGGMSMKNILARLQFKYGSIAVNSTGNHSDGGGLVVIGGPL